METCWHKAKPDELVGKVIQHVNWVEQQQSDLYLRLIKYAWLYDPRERAYGVSYPTAQPYPTVENVVANNVDTLHSQLSTEMITRFVTKGADWSAQRLAKRAEWYLSSLNTLLDAPRYADDALLEALKKGAAFVKVYACPTSGKVKIERVLADDIIVNEDECRTHRLPRNLAHRMFLDREELMARFPAFAGKIAELGSANTSGRRVWANYRKYRPNEVVAVEIWRRPVGKQGAKGYFPGRHAFVVEGIQEPLLDKEYHHDGFPIARLVLVERDKGYFGRGIPEILDEIQKRVNKAHAQEDKITDRWAFPITWVHQGDQNLTIKSRKQYGAFGLWKVAAPRTEWPQNVGGDWTQRKQQYRATSFNESGVSQMASNASVPARIESGAAVRELLDREAGRHNPPAKAVERFWIEIQYLMLRAVHELGADAPVVLHQSARGYKKITLVGVEPDDLRLWMKPANSLAESVAGLKDTVASYVQAGIITQEEARKLIDNPDLQAESSLFTAAIKDIDRTIEEILDGEWLVPEPTQNLELGIVRVQRAILEARANGAPYEVIGGLELWVEQAGWELAMKQQQAGMGPPPPQVPTQEGMAGALPPGVPGPPTADELGVPALN
jgi:polyhydroxyalkanoate synthesis regulator phasin